MNINKFKFNPTGYSLSDIVGYEEEKNELSLYLESIKLMKENDSTLSYFPKGILLAGDPGCGKTLFAKVLISLAGVPSYFIDGTAITGSIAKMSKTIDSIFKSARKNPVSIIFMDEVARFVSGDNYQSDSSRSLLSCLLTNMDGVTTGSTTSNTFLIFTCNNIDDVDPSLIRPGRIDKIINFARPNLSDRKAILEFYAKKIPMLAPLDLDYNALAQKCEGLSCATLKTLVSEASLLGLSKKILPVKDTASLPSVTLALNQIFLDRIFAGEGLYENKKEFDSTKERTDVIYHELGHSLFTFLQKGHFGDLFLFSNSKNATQGMTLLGTTEDDEIKALDLQGVVDELVISLAGGITQRKFNPPQNIGWIGDMMDVKFTLYTIFSSGLLGFNYVDFSEQFNAHDSDISSDINKYSTAIANEVVSLILVRLARVAPIVTNLYEFIKGSIIVSAEELNTYAVPLFESLDLASLKITYQDVPTLVRLDKKYKAATSPSAIKPKVKKPASSTSKKSSK